MTPADLESRLKRYIEAFPREELYLHVDRDKHIAGEDLWFSIYALSRETGRLSARSTMAYVELVNPWNTPVVQKRFQLTGGRGEGGLILPDSLSSGTYTIRAYTGWMRNFLPENCYMHDIDIYNPFKQSEFRKKVISKTTKHNSSDIEFFPEGGTLLSGVSNRIVVYCTNERGEGTRYYGMIRDNSGDSFTTFVTDETGYGSFLITPEEGQKYSVLSPSGSFDLPESTREGLSVELDNSTGLIEIIIKASEDQLLTAPENYSLIIHSGGNIGHSAEMKISEPETKISIPGRRFRGDVAHAVLIREDGRIMFERLFYTPLQEGAKADITADTLYKWRQKVNTPIPALTGTGDVISDWSISVAPEQASESIPGIGDYMIFGSEFGNIPWADVKDRAGNFKNDLIDNLLISSKSRWINWNDIVSGNYQLPRDGFEQYGHHLTATIRYRDEKESARSEILYMSARGKIADFRYARRDTAGLFRFVLPVDAELRNLIIQPEYADNNMILELEPSFSGLMPDTRVFRDTLTEQLSEIFSHLSFNYQATKIYETGLREEPFITDYGNLRKRRFYGIPEMEVFLDDYIRLPQMLEVFTELLPGIILRPSRSGYEIKITNPVTGTFYINPPLVMIDGLMINDLSVLADLDPDLVEKIEVVVTPYLVGDLVLNGIVNVITRSGDFSDIVLPDYAVELPYRVVEKPPRFIAPDYSGIDRMQSRIPDLRNTLYWNPSVKTEKDGRANAEFWTPDHSAAWMIIINGVTENGEPVTIRKRFNTE